MSLKKKIVKMKDHNSWLKLLWFKQLMRRERKSRAISDIDCIRAGYFDGFGKYPDLDNPTTFYEKINWLKLHYRNELMPVVSDKWEVRKYLTDLGFENLLIPVYGVYDSVKDFDPNKLPDTFVIKATHASGPSWSRIVKDKSKVDWFAFKFVMRQWFKLKIDWMGREWHYGEMTPRIICEKFMADSNGELRDYKIHCFNGEPKFMGVCIGRFTKGKRWYTFNPEGRELGHTFDSVKYGDGASVRLPENWQRMFELARELSKPFPYVRVDFYNVDGKIYFGELTFFDFSGNYSIYTEEAQKLIGSWMTLPEANN